MVKYLVCLFLGLLPYRFIYLYLVYDLLANRRSVKIKAHEDDVNSCCWADSASGNVLISASDDAFLKVWYVVILHLFQFLPDDRPGIVDRLGHPTSPPGHWLVIQKG